MEELEKKFRKIARKLSAFDIQADQAGWTLGWDDLISGNRIAPGSDLFLGKYSRQGIELIIDKFGFKNLLERRGFRDLVVRCDTRDNFRHTVRVYYGNTIDPEHLLFEMTARFQRLKPDADTALVRFVEDFNVLYIEWLMLQDPRSEFTPTRPRLPGQEHPGLGLGKEVLTLLVLMARHLKVDALLNVPEYYHTALMFSKRFLFFNPVVQATVLAVTRDLWQKYRLAVIAWGVHLGCVRETKADHVFRWQPHRQVVPLHPALRAYFSSEPYQAQIQRTLAGVHFTLDEETLRRKLAELPTPPFTL